MIKKLFKKTGRFNEFVARKLPYCEQIQHGNRNFQ